MGDKNRSERTPRRDMERGIRLLADDLNEALVVIQRNRAVFYNDALLDLLGYSPGESPPMGWEAFLPSGADPAEEGEDNLGSPEEVTLLRKDGGLLYVRNRTHLIRWMGHPATLHFLEDVTGRRVAEGLLEEQLEVNAVLADTVRQILEPPMSLEDIGRTILASARVITDCASGAVVFEDRDGRRIVQNHCPERCEECRIAEFSDRILSEPDCLARSLGGRIEGSYVLNGEHPDSPGCRKARGGSGIRNILRVPARTGRGMQGEIILIDTPEGFKARDLENMEKIAEVYALALSRRQTEDDLRAAKERAEREAEARSHFLASVSHEIRSPLNGVLMMSSLLEDTDLTEEQEELLGVVMFSARTIERLIADLSDLTQIRTGKLTIIEEDFDLQELCRAVVESNRPSALRKGLALESSLVLDGGPFRGDKARIGQILNNLVANAIKYTDQGRVRLSAMRSGDWVDLTVEDTGIGIPKDQQETIFGLFWQGDAVGMRKGEGAGIGLAIVKELTDVMGGRVEMSSEPGEGSSFTISLPVASGEPAREAPERPQKPLPSRGRVLVAEDEGVNRLYMRAFLEREGWSVEEAQDGIEAVAQVRGHEFDLVLMDISMPRMDGLEATRLIRNIRPFLPVIAITAHAYEDDRRRILEAGVNDIVLKPVDERALRRSLGRYLRLR